MALGSNCSGFCYKEAGKKSFKNIIFLCIIKLFYLFRNLKKKRRNQIVCLQIGKQQYVSKVERDETE